MASLLLVHPLFLSRSPEETASASPYFPLGLLYLAAFVREAGHRVSVFDATFEPDHSSFTDRVSAESPDIVGISALMPTTTEALELARIAKSAGSSVILGGPDPTLDPAPYLANTAVDLVVHHEGEQTLVRMLELLDSGNFDITHFRDEPGIAFREDDRVVVNELRAPIADLDSLPIPARDLIDMDRYLDSWRESAGYSSVTISTSRGCPYGCTWCRDAVHGRAYRQRSPANVAAEVAQISRTYDVERLRMVDDVDGMDREWFDEWSQHVHRLDAPLPFEALNDLERQDIPLLDVRDSL